MHYTRLPSWILGIPIDAFLKVPIDETGQTLVNAHRGAYDTYGGYQMPLIVMDGYLCGQAYDFVMWAQWLNPYLDFEKKVF